MALLLGVMLGLSMIAAAQRAGGGLKIEGAALRDCSGGDQAWNHDTPGQPPPRRYDGQLGKDTEDEIDSRVAVADAASELDEAFAGSCARLLFFEHASEASLRAREGQGARGPPLS
ncbi:MAG: hypothetical protein R6X02_34395 [Enhygromyxa sp.]